MLDFSSIGTEDTLRLCPLMTHSLINMAAVFINLEGFV